MQTEDGSGEGHRLRPDNRCKMALAFTFSAEEYKRRQLAHECEHGRLETQHVRLGYIRLLLVFLMLAMAWTSLYDHHGSPWLLAIPAVLFAAAVKIHSRVLRQQAIAVRVADVYRKGLARMEDRWPRTTERATPAEWVASSLYARDLDIVGKGSLFELLCVARTSMGERRLLEWLLTPASLETIYGRQQAVAELRGQLDFRERMAVAGQHVLHGARPEALQEWAESSSGALGSWLRWLALALALLAVGGTLVKLEFGLWTPLLVVLVVESALMRFLSRRIEAILKGLDHALHTLQLFSALLREIEGHTFQADSLNRIKRDLLSHRTAASDAIAALGNLAAWKDGRSNLIVKFLDRPLMYALQVALAVQRWRKTYGSAVGVWLAGVGELEALLSLAGYSYEHPDDPFPSFVEGPTCFEAHEIAHPLIPAQVCVRNSLSMNSNTRVLLISGSNMSGKSTLMRTAGINTVLAMCGAPVRAKQLQLTPLRVGASLLVNDSLAQGTSRFYAEIKKLQQICELARQDGPSVFFLLHEVLQGTNSSDRLIGTQGTLRELVRSGAIGILTTHDLSLTAIENDDGAIRNMHFQDSIVDGAMKFDCRLREGVVTKSNGVELMQLIGLKV